MTIALKKRPVEEAGAPTSVPFYVSQEILRAIQDLKYGSVEIMVHDSRVVQIERKEKIRFQPEYQI